MLARISRVLLLLASVAVFSACQGPDVGQSCTLTWGTDPSQLAPTSSDLYATCSADYVEFNAASGCENLVCIVSPAAPGSKYASTEPGLGYCSKPCVSDRDCYQSDTHLVCDTLVLDPEFLNGLDPEVKARYLGEIQYSSYCRLEDPKPATCTSP